MGKARTAVELRKVAEQKLPGLRGGVRQGFEREFLLFLYLRGDAPAGVR